MYTFKNTTYEEFVLKIDDFLKIDFDINRFDEAEVLFDKWIEKIQLLLTNAINPDADFFLMIFNRDEFSFIDSIKNKNDLSFFITQRKESLTKVKNYIIICQSLREGRFPRVHSTEDKFDFLLEQLNLIPDESFTSIEKIFEINDISFKSKETSEIAQILTKKGYITKWREYDEKNDDVKITVKGSAHIERKLRSKKKTQSTSKANSDLDKKIDEILYRLKKLNVGQEIIFDEIEEMRELQNMLSKKSWGQLLKGKLIDLTIEKVVDGALAGEIFKFLTDQSLKMLK